MALNTSPSAIASRRSVPQLPPILTTSFSNSLLDTSPHQLELMTRSSNTEAIGTRTVRIPATVGPTPLPTPAQIPLSTPPVVPRRTTSISKLPPSPRRTSSEYEAHTALHLDPQPATRQTKLRKSKSASFFNLFSKPKFERARSHKDRGLASESPNLPVRAPDQPDHATRTTPGFAQKQKLEKSKPSSFTRYKDMPTLDGAPPQRPTTAEPKSRSLSKNQKKDETSAVEQSSYHHPSWTLPPLFQAYPQSLKHATLEAASAHDSSSRLKMYNVTSGDDSSTSSHERPVSSRKDVHHSGSSTGPAEAQKTYVLVTAGYLLQYAADGPFDRLPEKVLKLTGSSAAFASDVIQGKHWVLQVVQNMEDLSAKSAMSQKSLLSKFSFHASVGKGVSTMLLIFDSPNELDSWMSTIRREIEVLAGRAPKNLERELKADHVMAEGAIPLRRYQSITKSPRLEGSPRSSPVKSHPASPTTIHPQSPILPNPASPTFPPSARGSQTTTLVGTGSGWSSTRSSRQYPSNRPSESSPFRCSQIQESPVDGRTFSAYIPIFEYQGPSSPVKEILVSDMDAEPISAQHAAVSASTSVATEKPFFSAPSSPLKAEVLTTDQTLDETEEDMDLPTDEADERATEAFLCVDDVSGGTSPLPSPMLNSFPQPNTNNPNGLPSGKIMLGRTSPAASIMGAQVPVLPDNTPYFRQRLPDPPTIVEEEEEAILAAFASEIATSAPHPPLCAVPVLPGYRASLLQNRGYYSEPPTATTPPRGGHLAQTTVPQRRESALQALTAEEFASSPDTSPFSDSSSKAGRRTSIMRSSTTPLPLRSSALISSAEMQAPLNESREAVSQQPLQLRRPPSMQVKRDQAPFMTPVRANTPSWESAASSRSSSTMSHYPASRSTSATRTPGSKRNSTLVPVVRPPSVRPGVRISKSFHFGPPQPPPSAPLPRPPQLSV